MIKSIYKYLIKFKLAIISDQTSPAYIRKDQSQLFEKGIKSSSAENVTEYCRRQQCDNESQILQPWHKYYQSSNNHHRIVQCRKSF